MSGNKHDELKTFFLEKFDNYHMKFGDLENMGNSNQRRVEQIAGKLEELSKDKIRFETKQETTDNKFVK